MGEDDEAEMDDGKMTLYRPLSVWVAAHPARKGKTQRFMSTVYLCLGPEDFFLAGVSVIECFSKLKMSQ